MVSSQLQWQPQKINENLSVRVAVLSTSLPWYDTEFTGIWYICFESDNEVQDHPVTMLSRFDPGGFFELHGHPGGEEILVLQGNFVDETGIYLPGTYILNPEGFIHHPYSDEGCLTFVKLRQHGGKNRQQVRKNIYELPWQSGIIPQIEVKPLYQQIDFPEKVWIERWQPGTALFNVVESEVKEIFVIEGTWSDELGNYPASSWLRYPPGYSYSPSSAKGCMVYVKTYPLDTTRFIVGKDFRHPQI
ncbi:MAG: cupin domain-containing protein [Nostoc sp. NMS1]|uniref:cupin domain-containing protein n=1 Tax=unclassified Nostoc TaxID=2593658 RepID=UPI0025D0D222|nr:MULTISPECIES: cupin domain-containing protein [unclassified Nostoc]MBN3908794.1 cupin domain-containing protein [Nostoc sp. NMS1]MBN3992308.1 cupin domain-containing protein [Nostoc sp. NMS2]